MCYHWFITNIKNYCQADETHFKSKCERMFKFKADKSTERTNSNHDGIVARSSASPI
jgi:hypothetical protein